MTDVITPFRRLSTEHEARRRYPIILSAMRIHFAIAGTLLVLVALVMGWYLYYSEFRRMDINGNLRITRAAEIYQFGTQALMAATGVVALAGVIQLRAAHALSHRQGAVLARFAAILLLIGFPAGVVLWNMILDVPGIPAGTLQLLLRVLAVVLLIQAILALWYQVQLTRPGIRQALQGKAVSRSIRTWVMIAAGILWLLVLIVLGIGLAVMTEWIDLPVSRPEPGQLLYATSFDAFEDEWDLYSGRDAAQILDAEQKILQITYGSPMTNEVVFSLLDRKFNDMDLRVTTRQISGPSDNQYGVIFRYRDRDHYYGFLISGDGYYSLVKQQDGTLEVISNWGESESIHQGEATNEIRIVALGEQFRFFINGQPVPLCLRGENLTSMWRDPGVCVEGGELTYIYKDDDFKQGRVALSAGSSVDLSEPVVVAFDDLVIIGPEENVMRVAP